jgi:hypothetical protein
MPAFTRGGIARGVKLALQNVFTPLQAVASALSSAALERENLKEQYAPVRVNIHIPNLPFWAFREMAVSTTESYKGAIPIPFALPMPQEFWNGTVPSNSPDVPKVFLTEVQLSWDQGDEGAAVQVEDAGVDGRLSKPAVLSTSLHLTLVEHSPTILGNTSIDPDSEVFSLDAPWQAYESDFRRFNPLVVGNLRKPMSPGKCYVLIIDAQDLYTAAAATAPLYLSIPSLTVSLKLIAEVMQRDKYTLATPIQNMPAHLGVQPTRAVTVTAPVADATIAAEGATGVQQNMATLDAVAQAGVEGGYEKDGSVPQYEEIDDSACYEIIAVPMMQNMTESGAVASDTVVDCNFVGVAPHLLALCDRRIVPLAYPIAIHHVVAGLNWHNPGRNLAPWPALAQTTEPSLATQRWQCGVGLMSGIRSDLTAVTQVAYTSTDCVSWGGTIDRIRWRPNLDPVRLVAVPLVGPAAPTESGYVAQGAPVWASRGTSRTTLRTGVYDTAGALIPSPTLGCEQALEVRMSLQDSVNGLAFGTTTWAGIGGHWVFIYGKKHLAATRNQVG